MLAAQSVDQLAAQKAATMADPMVGKLAPWMVVSWVVSKVERTVGWLADESADRLDATKVAMTAGSKVGEMVDWRG